MTEDNMARVSSSDPSASKQRKKRKWDQPAEHVVSAGIAASGLLPLSHVGSLLGTSLPGVALVSGVYFSNPLAATVPTVPPFVQVPPQQHMFSISQKLNQIQDEVIAREIVINEADSTVRYKLTKRQTQEEIQKSTGAIVITRGKYRPSNAPPDSEKPLYLHISAGAHLETTVERIKAVDHAAAMVEEMLKQGSLGNVNHSLSACVYLGFEVDPSVDIAARIRGPNDQYVNHIMNETGATVSLRGHGLGNSENTGADEGQQPLHLFLSSNNVKSLERAKLLAENLLDTISAEFSVSRFSSSKVYGAVPPPPQLLAEVQSSVDESKAKMQPAASSTSSAFGCSASAVGPLMVPAASIISPQGPVTQLGRSNSGPGPSQGFSACYSHSTLSSVTSYNGYGGIYPQATPLQQVALALRHSTSPITTLVTPAITTASTGSHASTSSSLEKEKRSSQKRKFQESPVVVKGLVNPSQKSMQVSEVAKPCSLNPHVVAKDIKKLMPPPPMPPPPPKFTSSSSSRVVGGQNVRSESKSESVPDTLIKLMEYGDEDDDELEEPSEEEPLKRSSNSSVTTKPFWAV